VKFLYNTAKASGAVIAPQKPVIHPSRAVISLVPVAGAGGAPSDRAREETGGKKGYLTCLCAQGDLITAGLCLCHVSSQAFVMCLSAEE